MEFKYQEIINGKALKWLKKNIGLIQNQRLIAIHVDKFIDEKTTKSEILHLSLNMYLYLIEHIKNPQKHMLSLVVPLSDIKKLKI